MATEGERKELRRVAVEKTAEIINHMIDNGRFGGTLVDPDSNSNFIDKFNHAWDAIYGKVYGTLTKDTEA